MLDYVKHGGFSTKIKNSNRNGNKIRNQLITCSKEGNKKSGISATVKTNSTSVTRCPARIYVISNVVLTHSYPCCPDQIEMLKQHRKLSLHVCQTIENNDEAGIRPSKTYKVLVAVIGGHRGNKWLTDNVELRYILERWSKNLKRRHRNIKRNHDEPLLEPRRKRFVEMVIRSHNICEFASDCPELTDISHRAFDNAMAEMQEYKSRDKGRTMLSHEDSSLDDVNEFQSPPHVKTRCPKKRLGSNIETKIANASKK
ncbi:hypothetical protein Ahy_B01g056578 [Arachis hypogaea]|uniref:Protein FAR1-RELATED SEQUENCE n=1 Tax=Arachis hypogaea TaxID=3818 RepID=A0A445AZ67_ARAHY|nr:hypothetical protein Ahy_B01g056578 [Arachis hypogaea]